MPSLKSGLGCVGGCQNARMNFGSALLLRWARRMEVIYLSNSVLSCHGLTDFLAAVDQDAVIQMSTSSMLEAAQADRLLHRCPVRRLALSGSTLPSCLPSSVTDLRASFWGGLSEAAMWLSDQCNALLYRADNLPQLTDLSLCLCTALDAPTPLVLTCPVQMANLQMLRLQLDLTAQLDLSWVHLQACPNFDCIIFLGTAEFRAHDAAVAQLRGLAIRSLTLRTDVPFGRALQELWSSLRVCSFHLHLLEDAFSSAAGALQCLPRSCTNIFIEATALNQVVFIRWAALVGQAANIRLITKPCATVQILGAGHACLADVTRLQQPWQLVVQGARSVYGLPAPLASDKTYFQQNAAACSADWTSDTE